MNELRAALELANQEELQHLTNILFCRRFNPLDYLGTPEPIDVQSQDWQSWLDSLEQRIRYLAADGVTVLRRKSHVVSYRQILIQVCRYLKIQYLQQMSTVDIEAEIFLHLLGQAWQKLPATEQKSLQTKVVRSLADMKLPQPLPVQIQHNPINLILKSSGVVALNSVIKGIILKQIATQFTLHFARYQVAKTALVSSSTAAIQQQLVMQTARRGMAISAARYGAVRSVFAVLGPALWFSLVADLGWKAIATNYSRIIPTVFTLAQIRLTRGEYWQPA